MVPTVRGVFDRCWRERHSVESHGDTDTDMSKDDEEDEKNKSLGPLRKPRFEVVKAAVVVRDAGQNSRFACPPYPAK